MDTTSKWNPTWPFPNREALLKYEAAYLAGTHMEGRRRIPLVSSKDLERERWLEDHMPERRKIGVLDAQVIATVYLWKGSANIEADGGCSTVPDELLREEFIASVQSIISADHESQAKQAFAALQAFVGVKGRVASAFMYWMGPDRFQVIDVRATAALNLSLTEAEFNDPAAYLWYCSYSADQASRNRVTLRQADRALFAYHKLLGKGVRLF